MGDNEKQETAIATKEQIEAAAVPEPKRGAAALVAMGDRGVMLRSLDDLLRFANMTVLAGLAPKGMNAQGAALAIQAGMERGLGALGGLQALVPINGNLSWRGQAAYALIQNSGACRPGTLRVWTEGEGEQAVGIAVGHRVGYSEPERREFAVADAKRAGLWGRGGPWTQYPKRMLAWRALGFLARDVFPDVLGGFPLAEEAEDYEHEPRRGETPATRVEAGLAPPAAHDPLLDVIAGKTPAPVIEVDVKTGEIVSDPPAQAASPVVRCRKHKDVDLADAETCWKCVAEARDVAEAEQASLLEQR